MENQKNKKNNLKVGKKIFSPSHGIGLLESVQIIETSNGTEKEFLKVVFEENNMSILIPTERSSDMGLRNLSSKELIDKAMEIFLSQPKKNKTGTWSKEKQKQEAKLYSGSILLLAEIIRDLYPSISKAGNVSYTEYTIYQNALDRFVSEVSIVKKLEKEKIKASIENILQNKSNSSEKLNDDSSKSDDSDLSFEDDEDLESFNSTPTTKKVAVS